MSDLKDAKIMYVVYDGRAIGGDTEDASVLLATPSKREAKQWAREYDGVAFEYDVEGGTLVNERELYR